MLREVRSFDSLEEMQQFLAKSMEEAQKRATPAQNAIGDGHHWCGVWDDGFENLVVFGRVTPIAEMEAEERRLGADDEEWEYTLANTLRNNERGLRFGMCYSQACPEGELGSTHVSDMVPLPETIFQGAKEDRWDLVLGLDRGVYGWGFELVRLMTMSSTLDHA